MEPPPRQTSKIPLPDACVIRKSVLGRASTFLEDDTAYAELRCSSAITQHLGESGEARHTFHSHTLNTKSDWAAPTGIACFHCCHSFETPPVPIPTSYDAHNKTFSVKGCYCSLACAKRAILQTFSVSASSTALALLKKMAIEVYDFPFPFPSAPPREALRMFGGHLDIDAFRSSAREHAVHTTPFVNSYLVIEEKERIEANSQHSDSSFPSGSIRGMRRPPHSTLIQPPPLIGESRYQIFLRQAEKA